MKAIAFAVALILGVPLAHAHGPITPLGAKGDGVTDDTAALQYAINALPNGGTLYIGSGNPTYCLSNNLLITVSNIRIAGPATLKICNLWTTIPSGYSGVPAIINIFGTSAAPISNITLDAGIRFYGLAQTAAEPNEPKAISGRYANNVRINGSIFENFGHETIWPTGDGTDFWQVDHNTFHGGGYTSSVGAIVNINGNDGSVHHNRFVNDANGNPPYMPIGFQGLRAQAHNNIIDSFKYSGISCGDGGLSSCIINHNTVVGVIPSVTTSTLAIMCGRAVTSCMIDGNDIEITIAGTSAPASGAGADGIYINQKSGPCLVSNNKIVLNEGGSGGSAPANMPVGILLFGSVEGAGCGVNSNIIEFTNPFSDTRAIGIIAMPRGTGRTLALRLSNNFVNGAGWFAYDINSNGGGTLNLTTVGDAQSGSSYIRWGDTYLDNRSGKYNNVPFYRGPPLGEP